MNKATLAEVARLPVAKRVEFALMMVGIYPIAALLHSFSVEEKFEVCAEIKTALAKHCNGVGIPIPIFTPGQVDDFLEDYQAAFWALGVSGEISRANFWEHTMNARKLILGETE